MPSIPAIIAAEYFTGFSVTSAWIAFAGGRYPAVRRWHDRFVERVGWPWPILTVIIGWPIIALILAVLGVPDDDEVDPEGP